MNHSGTWDVVVVAGPEVCTLSTGAPVLAHSEWVRLFLGRSVAQARVIEGDGAVAAVEYLVSGRAPDGTARPGAAEALTEAVWGAFEELAAVVSAHRRLVAEAAERGLSFHPEIFVRMYGVLRHVTVSTEVHDWRVTDEGVSIVRWGLRGTGQVPLLCWSDAELRGMRDRLLKAHGLPLLPPRGTGAPASRAAASVTAAIRALGERPATAEPPAASRPDAARRNGPTQPQTPPKRAPAPAPPVAAPPPASRIPAPVATSAPAVRVPASSDRGSAPRSKASLPGWLPWSVAGLSAILAVTFLVLATSTRSRATRAEDRAQRAESELEAIRQGLQGRRR